MKRLFCLIALLALPVCATINTFPLDQVRLHSGPFYQAQQTNIGYLMAMNPDRLLAPYRREAGLELVAEPYPNWESSGLDGHIGGHYLSALALMYSATGEQQLLERLNYMITELHRYQQKHGDGYLGGIPGGKASWQQIRQGQIEADLFILNKQWVPWYNLHKTFAGLHDAYVYAGNQQAKAMLLRLSDWTWQLASQMTDQQLQQMLVTEYGGMNDILAEVSVISGDPKYLQLALRFSELRIMNPLLQQQDVLDGLHANTQIPKIVGMARLASLTENEKWYQAADFFWQQVVNKRSVAIGGNSVREHFHPSDDFSTMLNDVEGPETCNTYNMLKLTKLLYQRDPQPRYMAYYERALYNHILSSQHPQHGGLVYFTPMRPNHYRVYSSAEETMWCCVGSGIENHAKYGEMIYAYNNDQLYVNLFVDSSLNWAEQAVKIRQSTQFPDKQNSLITIEQGGKFGLNIRNPHWVADKVQLTLNGKAVSYQAAENGYIHLQRHWRKGDQLAIELPMQTTLEQLPDNSAHYAILHGPIVLAARSRMQDSPRFIADSSRMGHIASGELCPVDQTPTFISDNPDFIRHIKPVAGKPLTFTTGDAPLAGVSGPLELIPFFRLHDSRYTLYFPHNSASQWQQQQQILRQQTQHETQLAQQTVDLIRPGEQQPEADHQFKGEQTEAGVNQGRHWRHATGWFSYRLSTGQQPALTLRLGYFGADSNRHFRILVNNQLLANVSLSGEQGDNFYHIDYPIPAELLGNNDSIELKFEANPGSIAGGIYEIRLMKTITME
ncbi:glycoside hydrolase family 127 protein [Chromatiaceae bacterium AAb-1]|nr:glycoside hydrolase family 127 protein [Chromatiaceae bacterium AAb-1]